MALSAMIAPVLFELDGVSLRREDKLVLDGLGAVLPEGASCLAGRRAPGSRRSCGS